MKLNCVPESGARSVPAEHREPAPTCCPVHVCSLTDIPAEELGYVPLLDHMDREVLLWSFREAPQFAQVPLERLFRERRGCLQVILLTDSDYYARQAAVYLATFAQLERNSGKANRDSEDENFWESTGLEALLDRDTENPLATALTVVSPKLLDPSLREEKKQKVAVLHGGVEERFSLAKVDTPAVLVAAPSGPVLTEQVLRQLACGRERDAAGHPLDRFIALGPGQVDLELLEELRFTHGYHVCRVGQPGQDYLCRVLRDMVNGLMNPLGTKQELEALLNQVDLDQVMAQVRRVRGERFCETDLESLVAWAVQRGCKGRLTTQDLVFTPFQDRKTGWRELKEMVGLTQVKQVLRRRLAAAALEDRRRQRGMAVEPMCRNLAFSGPPGTGKSVTARLAARILREEGCGTGRFVEAGREQLIGTYLGQTSPMVAGLFQRAKGGVLFIDEAGALLDNGQDIYAAEAVNALVRHMELEPETTVIFATYPGEMERLLSSNPGLSSRVSQVLDFPGYDDGALWEIVQSFAEKEGYALPEGAREVCGSFFSELRRRKGEDFGNGREARRLFQGGVEEMALRVLEEGRDETLTLADLERASQRLLARPMEDKRSIGF